MTALFARQSVAADYPVILKYPGYISGQAAAASGNPFVILVGIIPDTTGERFVGRCRIGNSSALAGNNHFHWQDSLAWKTACQNTWGKDNSAYYDSKHITTADSGETTKVWFISKCDTTPQSQYLMARVQRLVNDSTNSGINRDSPRQIAMVMDMAAQGGWLEGHIYGDPSYASPLSNYVVLAYRADTIVGSYLSENNYVIEGYDSGDPGYFMLTVPVGNIDSLKVRDLSDNPVNFYVKSAPAWVISAGDTVNIDILPDIPCMVYTSPANKASNVPLNAPVRIGFNKPINQTSFAYTCSTGASGWNTVWNRTGDIVTLTHNDFSYVTAYKFQVTAAQDLLGNDLVSGPKSNPFRFITQPDPAAIPLKIICLDVGQGNAAVIKSPSGKILLFDAGKTGKGYDKVWPFLRDSLTTRHLDYTVASHYQEDHIGGMDEVIDSLGGIDSVLVNGYDRGGAYSSASFTDYAAILGAKRKTITLNQIIDLGYGVAVECVAVNGQTYGDNITPSDENDFGVGLFIQYGAFKMIISGDLGGYNSGRYKDMESILAPDLGGVSALHVNHHGSQYSSNPYWVSTLDPVVSVISVGTNNYGHPTQLALDRLSDDPDSNNYIYLTESGSGGTVSPGRGEVVNGNIWIEVKSSYFTVNGDIYYFTKRGVPAFFRMAQNYPNPFKHLTTIKYQILNPGQVSLKVYNIIGQEVKILVDKTQEAGFYDASWDGRDSQGHLVAAGIYYYRLSVGQSSSCRKLVFIR
ncbi:Ig-like domain-containing protein [candidate division TA06 bacterium]|uniref:Ig-like domain-containing protein n=1 Tax=candidate division TA06 bacterium TaxID=2250710 RepID=A0A933IC44_UNCT6|nr:Ig-like domain-containing protein [candidate division TA06 bacterium]